MLSPFDQKNLKALFDDEKFESFVRFYQQFLDRIEEKNVIGESEFETLKLVFSKEAEKGAIKQFFRELEQEIYG